MIKSEYLDMNPEIQCDLDVTNTCRVKNLQIYKLRELLKKDSMNFQGTKKSMKNSRNYQ